MKSCHYILLFLLPIILLSCRKKAVEPVTTVHSFEKTYGTPGNDYAIAGLVDNDFLWVTGHTSGFNDPAGEVYLLKLDMNGEVILEKTYAGYEGTRLILVADGNYLLVGNTYSEGAGKSDVLVMKINANGEVLWKELFGGPEQDVAGDAVQLDDGSFIIGATTESFGAGSRDLYLIRLSASGNLVWDKTFGGAGLDGLSQLSLSGDGTLFLFGYTTNFGPSDRDFYLMNLSLDGDSLWARRIGSPEYEQSGGMAFTPDGNLFLAGHSAGVDILHSMYGIKLDMEGNTIWERHLGGAHHEGSEGCTIDAEGNYLMVGPSDSFGEGDEDIYFAKLSPGGMVIYETTFGGNQDDSALDIVSAADASFIIGQTASSGAGGKDVFVVRVPN